MRYHRTHMHNKKQTHAGTHRHPHTQNTNRDKQTPNVVMLFTNLFNRRQIGHGFGFVI